MQTTTNIGLKTYEANDPTDWLGEFNYNMNKIDEAVGSQNDQIDVIEETASTAVSTANTASTTATSALNTANTASTTATSALNTANTKASIDDTTTSTTKTWSSSKINTEVSRANEFPNYYDPTPVSSTNTLTSGKLSITYTTSEDCYIYPQYILTTGSNGSIEVTIRSFFHDYNPLVNQPYKTSTGRLYKLKANTQITVTINDVTGEAHNLWLYKLGIGNI